LRALTLDDPFDEYVFCGENPENLKALKARVKRHAPGASVAYVEGDCNAKVIEILAKIPIGSKTDTGIDALLCRSLRHRKNQGRFHKSH
jgi:hypothetical protein